MTIEFKDIIYLVVYIISLAAFLQAMRNRQANFEKELGQVRKILYGDRGTLNLVDCKTCEKYRDEIFIAIRRSEKALELFLIEIRETKEMVIKLNMLVEMLTKNGIKKD